MSPKPLTPLTHAQGREIAEVLGRHFDLSKVVVVSERDTLSQALASLPISTVKVAPQSIQNNEALMMCSPPSSGGDIDLLVAVPPLDSVDLSGQSLSLRVLCDSCDTLLLSPALPVDDGIFAVGPLELWRNGFVLALKRSVELQASLCEVGAPPWFYESLGIYVRGSQPAKVMAQDLRSSARIEGSTSLQSMALLMSAATQVPVSHSIVELGAWRGRTSAAMALVAGGRPLYSIDHHHGDRDLSNRLGVELSAIQSFPEMLENLQALQLQEEVVPICQDSLVAVCHWAGLPPGLFFLDTAYDEEEVRLNFEAWYERLAPGAIVVFGGAQHDGVMSVVQDAVAQGLLSNYLRCADVLAALKMPFCEP